MDAEVDDGMDENAWIHEDQAMAGNLDFDESITSATHSRHLQGADAGHLSKVWRISIDEANRTMDITMQGQVDTFFVIQKATGKSTRGHTCCQLFNTDKGFVYLIPLRTGGDIGSVETVCKSYRSV